MKDYETLFVLLLATQFFHSIEELSNRFHEKFPLFRMKFRTFLVFEILFFGFWTFVLFTNIRYRVELIAFFNMLMLLNGWWHIVWWAIVKKYVPGLVTAPAFVIFYVVFYFRGFY